MIGTTLAHFEITAHLGSGGMGDVYQASDTKLGRSVAIKFLPEAFSHDTEHVARFQREARVLASLSHPNIAAIHGLEEANGRHFLIMELVPGETLAERIKRGAIPIEEALPIAKQIAEALEAAHEQGIIHRDLKPANIKITPAGKVKVLDFGLAKAMDSSPSPTLSNSPTLLSAAASNAGVILGTAAYMSPEQAKGKAVDRRADIWAFGVVLYEMLTGQSLFPGETASETMAFVMTKEPDWTALPANTPPSVREFLRRCLVKDPRNRVRDIGDVRIAIEETSSGAEPNAPVPQSVSRRSARLWVSAFAVATFIAATLAVPAVRYFRASALLTPSEMRLEISTPFTSAPLEFALSPDGRFLVFVASGDGPQRLWLRSLDKTEAQPMAGTEGADYPFWSPDSRSIGFVASGKLQRIDVGGGSPQILASTDDSFRGGTWNADGTILFNVARSLSRIAASGGQPVPIGLTGVYFPQFLGREFLFYGPYANEPGIYLGSLDSRQPKRLTAADSAGAYLAPDMIAFVRGTSLMVQHLDLTRRELTGEPMRLADPVGINASGFGGFSVSADGRIAYRGGALRQLRWYDRTGKALGTAGEPDSGSPLYLELSPDGKHVAYGRAVQNNFDVWLSDLLRGGMTRFTFDPRIDTVPVWSPDGTRIVFYSTRKGAPNLYLKPSSGAGAEELLLESPNAQFPQDWSRDGRFLLYGEITQPQSQSTGRDLWALPMTGNDRKPIVVAKTPFEELNGQFSPDGRWVAYETNESGRFEIVVQPFPVPTGKWQVSTGGGVQPRWQADGKELYFVAPDGKMMAAPITAGATFAAGTPVALFPANLAQGSGTDKQEYAVSRDGRFLIIQPAEASSTSPITLILNWKPPKP